jgi:hypothetical protein
MTDRSTPELDSFETALLAELREEVRQHSEHAPVESLLPTSPPPARHRRRWIAAAATAAAAVAAATQIPGLGLTPAYAITDRNDGQVKVRVNRLEGADRLEQALREHGIPADITYLPKGKECAPHRYTERRTPGMMLEVAHDWFRVTIPPGAVGKDDTFVLSASVVTTATGLQVTTEFGIADGPVTPCQVIDSP